MVEKGLKTAHNQASASHIQQMGLVLDHLVDALGGTQAARSGVPQFWWILTNTREQLRPRS